MALLGGKPGKQSLKKLLHMPTKRVIIVGAGISGLAAAYRLEERAPDAEITLLEQEHRPGGTAWTLRDDGFQLEIGPNGFLDNNPATATLCRDVGLADRLIQASATAAQNRFLLLGDRLKMLPGGMGAFLRTDLLSWRGKLALILERFRRPAQGTRDESIDTFARRRAGREVADVFADALVTGIYAGDPHLLSLPACFPRIAAVERQYGSVLKGFTETARQQRRDAAAKGEGRQPTAKMWSFREGLRLLIETLANSLRRPPVLEASVRRIQRRADSPSWLVCGEGTDHWQADAIILTCPAYQQAVLLAGVDAALADEIAAIAYNRVAVVGLGFRRTDVPLSLEGFGFIAPQNTRHDLLGVQWCSSIFPGRAPEGAVLLRAMCGGWHRADMVGWDDGRLLAAIRAELRLSMGITALPIFQKIIRWDRAIPQYHVGHLERLERVDQHLTRHPGLFLGGNAYRGVALNDCTEQGQALAARVVGYLKTIKREATVTG
jgi:oxygen-dependent protoporphyrinogen oxidase